MPSELDDEDIIDDADIIKPKAFDMGDELGMLDGVPACRIADVPEYRCAGVPKWGTPGWE